MDLITLASNIANATTLIDAGRKGFATKGRAEEGRINYEKGIAVAMTAFQEAQSTADPQTILLAEYTFLSQELQPPFPTDRKGMWNCRGRHYINEEEVKYGLRYNN